MKKSTILCLSCALLSMSSPLAAKHHSDKHHHHKSSSSSSSSSHHHSHSKIRTYISAVANGTFSTQTVAPNAPIQFNTIVDQSHGILYGNGNFTIIEPGTYEISFGGRWGVVNPDAAGTEPIVSMTINDVVFVPSSIDSIDQDWTSNSLILFVLEAGAVIEFINNSSNSIELVDISGGNATSFFATIKKIS